MNGKDVAKRERCIAPVSDIREEESTVILRLEMPGVTKENLDVQIENDELRIFGKIPASEYQRTDYLIKERSSCDYRKIFTLDETIDREKIDAQMSNGVLTLTLQMKEAVKPRKIEIK